MGEAVRIDARVEARGLDVDLSVGEGGLLALIGANGAGKTTCVQLIAGALQPDAGTVEVGGVLVADPARFVPPYCRRIGYLDQRPLLFPHLNVLDNVAFGPRARGVAASAARRRAAAELDAVGLAELGGRRISELSGGQAQRVALARALAIDPEVVLLDEPFAALDAAATPELRRMLRERLRSITTVLVTHDPLDVLALADEVACLEGGRVVLQSGVDEVFQNPPTRFLADFVGLNLLSGGTEGASSVRIGTGEVVTGLTQQQVTGPRARAVFPPAAVSVFRDVPHGSPRNELAATVIGVEDRGNVQRIGLAIGDQRIHADITPAALRDLNLAAGEGVCASIKATQVAIFPAP